MSEIERYTTRRKDNEWQYLLECLHQQITMFLEDKRHIGQLEQLHKGLLDEDYAGPQKLNVIVIESMLSVMVDMIRDKVKQAEKANPVEPSRDS